MELEEKKTFERNSVDKCCWVVVKYEEGKKEKLFPLKFCAYCSSRNLYGGLGIKFNHGNNQITNAIQMSLTAAPITNLICLDCGRVDQYITKKENVEAFKKKERVKCKISQCTRPLCGSSEQIEFHNRGLTASRISITTFHIASKQHSLCNCCGHVEVFLPEKQVERVKKSEKWQTVSGVQCHLCSCFDVRAKEVFFANKPNLTSLQINLTSLLLFSLAHLVCVGLRHHADVQRRQVQRSDQETLGENLSWRLKCRGFGCEIWKKKKD